MAPEKRSGRRRVGEEKRKQKKKKQQQQEGEEHEMMMMMVVAQALLELRKGPQLPPLPLPNWAASRKRSLSATTTCCPSSSSPPQQEEEAAAAAAVAEPELPVKLFGVLPLVCARNDGKASGHVGVIAEMEDKRANRKLRRSPTSPLSRSRSFSNHGDDDAEESGSASPSAEVKAINEAGARSAATVPEFLPLQSCQAHVGTRDTAGSFKGKGDRKRKLTIMLEELSVENEELRQQIMVEQQRMEKLKALKISLIQQKKQKFERVEKPAKYVTPDLNLPPIPELEME